MTKVISRPTAITGPTKDARLKGVTITKPLKIQKNGIQAPKSYQETSKPCAEAEKTLLALIKVESTPRANNFIYIHRAKNSFDVLTRTSSKEHHIII